MEGRKIYYGRVSSTDQNAARQIEAFKKIGAKDNEIIIDKMSGKDFEREGYKALKSVLGLRAGDSLILKEIDRFGRTKEGILEELAYWKKSGVRVMIMDIPTTMIEMPKEQNWVMELVNNILIEVYSSLAQKEREDINRRQAEGIATMPVKNGKKYSVKTGRYTGRPAIQYPKEWDEHYSMWKSGKMTAKKCMDTLGLKRSSFYNLVNKYEKK